MCELLLLLQTSRFWPDHYVAPSMNDCLDLSAPSGPHQSQTPSLLSPCEKLDLRLMSKLFICTGLCPGLNSYHPWYDAKL